jgi:hypothetical protein
MTFQEQVVLLFIGQLITLLGVIVSGYINYQKTKTLYQVEIEIKKRAEYLERQLAEFYGPISALLHVQRVLIETRWNPETQEKTDLPDEIWEALRDEMMIPNAQAIAEIIKNKFHLIDNLELPQIYQDYIVHAQMWPLRIRYKADYPKKFRFPEGFDDEIHRTTKRLKEQYYELIARKKTNS